MVSYDGADVAWVPLPSTGISSYLCEKCTGKKKKKKTRRMVGWCCHGSLAVG